MRLLRAVPLLALGFLPLACASNPDAVEPAAAPHAQWSYEGEHGPAHWAASFPECAGTAQSPIDLTGAEPAELMPLQFGYREAEGRVRDLGHAIQVDIDGGALQVGDDRYELRQIHFHAPSEHTIDGKAADAAAHFVHADAAGALAVVAVLFVAGDAAYPAIDGLWRHLPGAEHADKPIALNVADLLPPRHGYYTYQGSLTTPPCTEGVRWIVLQDPLHVSAGQLQALQGFYNGNARPVQPLNDRSIRRVEG